jgi:hypothetical protein
VIPLAKVLRLLINVTRPTPEQVAFAERELAKLPPSHPDYPELAHRLNEIRRRMEARERSAGPPA